MGESGARSGGTVGVERTPIDEFAMIVEVQVRASREQPLPEGLSGADSLMQARASAAPKRRREPTRRWPPDRRCPERAERSTNPSTSLPSYAVSTAESQDAKTMRYGATPRMSISCKVRSPSCNCRPEKAGLSARRRPWQAMWATSAVANGGSTASIVDTGGRSTVGEAYRSRSRVTSSTAPGRSRPATSSTSSVPLRDLDVRSQNEAAGTTKTGARCNADHGTRRRLVVGLTTTGWSSARPRGPRS